MVEQIVTLRTYLPWMTVWVIVWAGAESLAAFYGLNWAMTRSNRVFFSLFGGGVLLRLVSIGVVAYLTHLFNVSPTIPLLSLVFAYFLLSIVQLPFFNYGLR